jgi:hypothetical protein
MTIKQPPLTPGAAAGGSLAIQSKFDAIPGSPFPVNHIDSLIRPAVAPSAVFIHLVPGGFAKAVAAEAATESGLPFDSNEETITFPEWSSRVRR